MSLRHSFQKKFNGNEKHGSIVNNHVRSHSGDTGKVYDNIRIFLGRGRAGHSEHNDIGFMGMVKVLQIIDRGIYLSSAADGEDD